MRRAAQLGPLPLGASFWSRVDKTATCWLWTGSKWASGYGRVKIADVSYAVHRAAYATLVAPIPDDLLVLHRCDTPACVNPEHLFLGTDRDNRRDCVTKGRARIWNSYKTHCKNGHAFTPANTYRWHGSRLCRTCNRDAQRRVAAKEAA